MERRHSLRIPFGPRELMKAREQIADLTARTTDHLCNLSVRHLVEVVVHGHARELLGYARKYLPCSGAFLRATGRFERSQRFHVEIDQPRPIDSVAQLIQTEMRGRAVQPGRYR